MIDEILGVYLIRDLELPLIENLIKDRLATALFISC